mgnify:CR=1 FL=1
MKISINVPENLGEITLNQYQRWLKIVDKSEVNEFYQQKMIEIFCNIELKQILNLRMKDVNEITTHLDKLFLEEPDFVPLFNLGEDEFGFVPKLDDMTFGEYIDLDTYLADWQTMDEAMSVLFRPVTFKRKGKYLIEKYESASKYDLSEMPLDVALGSLIFFYNLNKELQKHIMNYLSTQQEIDIPQDLRDLLKNGDGISPYIHSVKEILSQYQGSLN